MIKHKQWKANIMADALSRRHSLLSILETKFLSFNHIKELYPKDVDFSPILSECHQGAYKDFYLLNQYLFKGKRLLPISLTYNSASLSRDIFWLIGWKWPHFVSMSTITQMESCPLTYLGKCVTKSMEMLSHFHWGISRGSNVPTLQNPWKCCP